MPGDRPQQPRAVLDLGDHLDLVLAQQRHETLAQQREILGDHYPHGSLASTTVPSPSGLSTLQAAVEGLHPGAQAGEPRALRVGAAAAVVAHDHDQRRGARR